MSGNNFRQFHFQAISYTSFGELTWENIVMLKSLFWDEILSKNYDGNIWDEPMLHARSTRGCRWTMMSSSCADWPMALVNMRWCSSQTNFFQTTRSCYHKEIIYPHGALKFSRYMIWQNRSLQQLNFVRTFVRTAESLIYTCWHIYTNL